LCCSWPATSASGRCFGLFVHLGDRVLHEAVARTSWLDANAWMIGAATILLAGLYQFAPLKHRCLDRCRSPLAFVMEHWRGGRPETDAFRLGVRHGIFCVGCCWSLMLLMLRCRRRQHRVDAGARRGDWPWRRTCPGAAG